MPEVAEIALTAEILSKQFHGETLISFDFVSGRFLKNSPPGFDDFIKVLPLKLKRIDSKGKFMWFVLGDPEDSQNKWYIWNTFGLTGMWSLHPSKTIRAILTF